MADVRKSAYHYRLHLTKGQQRILEQQLEQCRSVFNQTLAARRDAWEQRQETLKLYDTQAMLPDWKAERPSLKLVHSQVLQNVQVRGRCGAVVKKSLSMRMHQCPDCGLEIDRDLNAAYNILRLGLQSQGRMPQEALRL